MADSGHQQPRPWLSVASPGPELRPSGLGRLGKARDPLADNDRQLLMPSRRDLPCGFAFQEPLDGGKCLLAGGTGFDLQCELGEAIGEGHGWASRLLPNGLGYRQSEYGFEYGHELGRSTKRSNFKAILRTSRPPAPAR
jgi:hypothetical protein